MKYFATFLFVLLSLSLYAQRETDNWYFGLENAVSFASGTPEYRQGSQIRNLEGCASISDSEGNLLFYTAGDTVYNQRHQPMPNGKDLMGDYSATQSAIIVPFPSHVGKYFIFTVDACQNFLSAGFRYSVVNMALNNGLGDVSVKNILITDLVAEKITAVLHQNQHDYWMVVHKYNSSEFWTYLLTEEGLSSEPVISQVGSWHGLDIPEDDDACALFGAARGYMKASPNGKKIAVALNRLYSAEVFDFDALTGVISNPILFSGYEGLYGLEFSPDSKKLYFSSTETGNIYQCNLELPDNESIINSMEIVAHEDATGGALQLASDGKIYIAYLLRYGLAAISNPNTVAENIYYVQNAVPLNNYMYLGLPNFVPSYFLPDFTVANTCEGDSTRFECQATFAYQSVSWDFDDPASGNENHATEVVAHHVFTESGTFRVKMTIYFEAAPPRSFFKTVEIRPKPDFDLPDKILECEQESVLLEVPLGHESYFWLPNESKENSITVYESGEYTVFVKGNNGCTKRDTVQVTISHLEIAEINTEAVSCYGNSDGSLLIEMEDPTQVYQYSIDGGTSYFTGSQQFSGLSAGIYNVKVKNQDGCITPDTPAEITEPDLLQFADFQLDTPNCHSDFAQIQFTVQGGTGTYSYELHNGSGVAFEISDELPAGNYLLEVHDEHNCRLEKNFTVSLPDELIISLSTSLPLCYNGNSGAINAQIEGGMPPYRFSWSNGASTQNISNLYAGIYTLTLTDANECQVSLSTELSQPDELKVDFTLLSVACFGEASGKIQYQILGATPPYFIDFFDTENNPLSSLTNLQSGIYSYIAKDKNACLQEGEVEITEPDLLEVSHTKTDLNCFESNDGTIELTISGGTPDYEVRWQNPSLSGIYFENLPAGTFFAEITDANFCQTAISLTLAQPDRLRVEAELQHITCNGGKDGEIKLTSFGGTLPHSLSPDNEELTLLSAGSYTILLTDANGCQSTLGVELTEPDELSVQLDYQEVSCFGFSDGSIDLSLKAGSFENLLFEWSNGSTTQNLYDLPAGKYAVKVTNRLSFICAEAEVFLSEPEPLEVQAKVIAKSCNGESDGVAEITILGGTPAYFTEILNSNEEIIFDVNSLYPDTYTINIQDKNACEEQTKLILESMECEPEIEIPNVFSPNGDGKNDFFNFTGKHVDIFSVSVFNRWGTAIYKWNTGEGWDGKIKNISGDSPAGIYYYLIQLTGKNTRVYNYKGFFYLIR